MAPAFPTTEFELNIFFVIELTNRYAKQKSEITEHYRSLSRCSFTLHVTFSQPDKIRSQVTNFRIEVKVSASNIAAVCGIFSQRKQ